MRLNKLMFYGTFVSCLCALGLAVEAQADSNNHPPSSEEIALAEETSDLMLATMFAALTQEFDETTPDNVEQGKRSISLIFADCNTSMRLVGTLEPLRENDVPRDDFEEDALEDALVGQARTEVQRVHGKWHYRRSVPLSNFRSECALCHTNFPPGPTADWVGALMFSVPIRTD